MGKEILREKEKEKRERERKRKREREREKEREKERERECVCVCASVTIIKADNGNVHQHQAQYLDSKSTQSLLIYFSLLYLTTPRLPSSIHLSMSSVPLLSVLLHTFDHPASFGGHHPERVEIEWPWMGEAPWPCPFFSRFHREGLKEER